MITGKTRLIAHLGYPTEMFKSPMIYNPYFEARHRRGGGADGRQAEDYAAFLPQLFRLTTSGRDRHHAAQGHDRRPARRGQTTAGSRAPAMPFA